MIVPESAVGYAGVRVKGSGAEGAVVADAEHRTHLTSPWLANMLAFSLMFALVVGWFYVQTREAQRLFLADAGEHARLLADAVALHARGAVLAQDATDTLLTGFLGSSARFIEYLDNVEPFRDDELNALAEELGLAIIRIERADNASLGHPGAEPSHPLDCSRQGELLQPEDIHIVLFAVPRNGLPGCILVGMDNRQFEEIRDTIGLPRAMRTVQALPGVLQLELHGEVDPMALNSESRGIPRVEMGHLVDGRTVAEVEVPLGGAKLRLTLDAGPLLRMRDRQSRAFLLFASVLALAGGMLSWLLYRHQRNHLEQLRSYERRLSQQREEAGLGRAAAAIAHEIRNPLNAMGMGLQRLQIEATELDVDHQRLVAVMRDALDRSNQSITELLDFARPCRPQIESMQLSTLLQDVLALYTGQMRQKGIRVTERIAEDTLIAADPGLLRRVLDNVLRNVLEAQPDGGWMDLHLGATKHQLNLQLSNGGLELSAEEAPRILEPWFTTRPEGTGLGLAISRRIINAHGGSLDLKVPEPGTMQLHITLPRKISRGTTENP